MTQVWRVVLRHFQIAPLPKGDVTDTDCEQITFNEQMANEGLTLETLAVETLYSGQFALYINLVDQTELSSHTPHRRSTSVSLETFFRNSSSTCNDKFLLIFRPNGFSLELKLKLVFFQNRHLISMVVTGVGKEP